MSKQDFEIRFDKAYANLNSALKELEKVAAEKIHEAAEQSRLLHVLSDENSLNATANEQKVIIQNLTNEINKLQQSLENLGQENEVLIEENQKLTQDLAKIKEEGIDLIDSISAELNDIDSIISGEKNG